MTQNATHAVAVSLVDNLYEARRKRRELTALLAQCSDSVLPIVRECPIAGAGAAS